MKLLMSDTSLPIAFDDPSQEHYMDLSSKNIGSCIGCFGCWTKTPGKCVIRDDATNVYPLIATCTSLIIVSAIKFGTYDTIMKTMLERTLPTQQAFLRIHKNETHHVQRHVNMKKAIIIAYGCISQKEKDLFTRLVQRNAHNFMYSSFRIIFTTKTELTQAVRKEVSIW